MPTVRESPEQVLERDVLDWADAVYDEAERELAETREIRILTKLIDYISGQQWNIKARFGRSRPTINRMFRHFIEIAALLTDIEPDFKVNFLNVEAQFDELGDLLNESVDLWARMSDFEGELLMAVMWALTGAAGYSKQSWNPSMFGGLGDVEYLPLGPLQCMTIGGGNRLQDAEVVVARWPVTIESLVRTYGERARHVQPDCESGGMAGEMSRPGKMSQSTWERVRLNPQLKKLLGKPLPQQPRSRYPKAMLRQFWFKDASRLGGSTSKIIGPVDDKGNATKNWCYRVEPGELIYPRGRLVVIAGGRILQDTCNPYWHAMFPFARLRLIRVPWSNYGLTPLDPIALMSDVINRINGGILDMIRASIEPRMVAPKAAFSQSVVDSIDPGAPGGKILYNNNTPREPQFPKPPELPAYVLTMKQDVEREQDQSSGSAAINQSLQKKQVPGGDSLDMIMNSRSIPIRFMGGGLRSYLTEVGVQVVAAKMQFENSLIRAKKFGTKGILDSDFEPYYGSILNKGMQPEEFVRQVIFEIRKGSLLNIEKQDEIQIAFLMRKMGDLSRKALYRKLGIKKVDQDKIEGELQAEAMQKAAAAGVASNLSHAGHK